MTSPSPTDADSLLDYALGYANLNDPSVWRQLTLGAFSLTLNLTSLDDMPLVPVVPAPSSGSLIKRDSRKHPLSKRGPGALAALTDLYYGVGYKIVPSLRLFATTMNSLDTSLTESLAITSGNALPLWQTGVYTPVVGLFTFDSSAYNGYTKVDTPWGRATPFYYAPSTMWCVGCYVLGQFIVSGTVKFTPVGSYESGFVNVAGKMRTNLSIAINSSSVGSWAPGSQSFGSYSSYIYIPGVVTVSYSMSSSISARTQVTAPGWMLAGAVYDWSSVNLTMDLVNSSTISTLGLDRPSISPIFGESRNIKAGVDASVALTFQFTTQIFNGCLSTAISYRRNRWITTPSLSVGVGTAPATTINYNAVEYTLGNPTCPALHFNMSTFNSVAASYYNYTTNTEVSMDPRNYQLRNVSKCGSNNPVKRRETSDLTPRQQTPGGSNYRGGMITTINDTLVIRHASNGNIYAVPKRRTANTPGIDRSGFWVSGAYCGYQINTVGDTAGRVLFAYQNSVGPLGVSRLRLAPFTQLPATAFFVTLAAIENSSLSSNNLAYVGLADMNGTVYYPTVCTYSGSLYPRLFLSNDTVNGPQKLMDPTLSSSITGGNVTYCGVIKLTTGLTYGWGSCVNT